MVFGEDVESVEYVVLPNVPSKIRSIEFQEEKIALKVVDGSVRIPLVNEPEDHEYSIIVF